MLRYVTRRSAGWLAMIVVATNVTYFLASWFMDPRSAYKDARPALTERQIDQALAPYGLDPGEPLVVRWWHWLGRVALHLDWGRSPTGVPVGEGLGTRILTSAELMLTATVLSVLLGVGLSVFTAARQYGWGDRGLQFLSVFLFNVPTPVAALAVVFGGIWLNQHLGWRFLYVTGIQSPAIHGFWPLLVDSFRHLVLPTLSLTALGYVGYHLTQRSLLLDSVNSAYVRTARATGLTHGRAIRRHALRTSLIPTATSVAFGIPAIFTGAVITETVFGWNGMGKFFTDALSSNDIHGSVLVAAFGAAMTAIGAILADIALVLLDPRVRVS